MRQLARLVDLRCRAPTMTSHDVASCARVRHRCRDLLAVGGVLSADQVDLMTDHARQLLARIPPARITLGRVLYHPRAVMLDARPHEALEPVLRAVQQATRIATGREGMLYHEPWVPHITVAYSNMVRPAAPVIQALGRELLRRDVTITSISLVRQAPEHLWTWHRVADVKFEG
jgi:2'-5' RNA ligase